MTLNFYKAFETFILNQKVIGWGFMQPERVKLPNGWSAFPCGYYTEYENGYKMVAMGSSLGKTAVQEAMILDPAGIPIARDTEDLKDEVL